MSSLFIVCLKDKEQQMYKDRGFRVEQVNASAVYFYMGKLRAEVSHVWMDHAVVKGRTLFVSVFFVR